MTLTDVLVTLTGLVITLGVLFIAALIYAA